MAVGADAAGTAGLDADRIQLHRLGTLEDLVEDAADDRGAGRRVVDGALGGRRAAAAQLVHDAIEERTDGPPLGGVLAGDPVEELGDVPGLHAPALGEDHRHEGPVEQLRLAGDPPGDRDLVVPRVGLPRELSPERRDQEVVGLGA